MRTYTLDGKKLPLKGDAKPACETCRFWDAARAVVGPPLPDDSPWIMSACRRRAPQASVNWPKVLSTDWCGEYEEAAQAVK